MNGGGYAYQKAGRRPWVERHTAGQVDARDVPHQTEYRVDAQFDVDKEPWYTGTVEDVGAFWGVAGPPPLPDDVPELVKLALGNRVNRPINIEIAMSWVLATDSRLKERFRSRHKCITRLSITRLSITRLSITLHVESGGACGIWLPRHSSAHTCLDTHIGKHHSYSDASLMTDMTHTTDTTHTDVCNDQHTNG